jgi:hypothetical protein
MPVALTIPTERTVIPFILCSIKPKTCSTLVFEISLSILTTGCLVVSYVQNSFYLCSFYYQVNVARFHLLAQRKVDLRGEWLKFMFIGSA